jgi:two-component system, sensor histidine kinase and response regulator
VGEMLHDAGRFRQDEAADKGIAFQFEIQPKLPAVFGHSDYLLEVFDRLIDNAIKFTYNRKRKDGRVTLRAWESGGEVYLAIVDNGVGFPEHARHQIFDLFSQYNREKMEQQGSGSGLAIVRGLVELHHSRIEVTSREGAGSQFTVVLPVHKESHPTIDSELPPQLATVLLVEDDQFLLEGLRELLEIEEDRFRFRVLSATNGREALTVLGDERPDLIISDVMMPVMDGYQLLAEVRKNQSWLHIPFIFLSAKGEQQDIHHGRRQGAEQYITKPYESDELLRLVYTQLDRYFQVQTVVNQDFEELKRGILALLQPGFKTPLDSVTDYSQQLAVRLQLAQTDADLRDSLQGLQEASDRLTRLVEDFITLAELKTGEKGTAYENRAAPIAVDTLLYGICFTGNEQWLDLPLQVQLESDPPSIYGDEQALTQLLRRLVETVAMLWSREKKGVVYLTAVGQPDWLKLIVSLDGAAFTAAEAEQVIGLFADDDRAALQAIEYGPALTIAKGIAELHGGYLRLENEPDRYCKIALTLPIYVPEQP